MTRVMVAQQLYQRSSEFSFNKEKYEAGLEALSLPDQAIETLRVKISGSAKTRNTLAEKGLVFGTYNGNDHEIRLYPFGFFALSNEEKDRFDKQHRLDEWPPSTNRFSRFANAVLAHETGHAADYTLQTPIGIYERGARYRAQEVVSRLGTGALIGGALGALIDNQLPLSPSGDILAGMATLGIYKSFLPLIEYFRWQNAYDPHPLTIESSAEAFASSSQAVELFSDIIHIEPRKI